MGKSQCVGCSDHSSAIPDALGAPVADGSRHPPALVLTQNPGAGLLPSEVAWLAARAISNRCVVAGAPSPSGPWKIERLFRGNDPAKLLRVPSFGAVVPPVGTGRSPGTLAVSSSLIIHESRYRRICCCVRFVGR